MEREHKEILREHHVKLVNDILTDNSKLLDFLIRQRVLEDDMVDNIRAEKTRLNQARELLRILPTRGPKAFGHFLCCLQLSAHEHLARSLYDACRTPPTLLIDRYDNDDRQALLELCGMQIPGDQSSATLAAQSQLAAGSQSQLAAGSQSQLAAGSQSQLAAESDSQVDGVVASYNIDASTLILNMGSVQKDILTNVFTMRGQTVEYTAKKNSDTEDALNVIKRFIEQAKTSVVCVVVSAPGDALNDQTPVSGGATSFGALRDTFCRLAESPDLANKSKCLLLIGSRSDDQMAADETDAGNNVRGQAESVDARAPSVNGSTGSTQGTSNTHITPSGADGFVLQVNLPEGIEQSEFKFREAWSRQLKSELQDVLLCLEFDTTEVYVERRQNNIISDSEYTAIEPEANRKRRAQLLFNILESRK